MIRVESGGLLLDPFGFEVLLSPAATFTLLALLGLLGNVWLLSVALFALRRVWLDTSEPDLYRIRVSMAWANLRRLSFMTCIKLSALALGVWAILTDHIGTWQGAIAWIAVLIFADLNTLLDLRLRQLLDRWTEHVL